MVYKKATMALYTEEVGWKQKLATLLCQMAITLWKNED